MPKTEYELTTPVCVSREDLLELLQDPERFLIAGGTTIKESIQYDESTGKVSGQSTTGIPLLEKPKFNGTFKKTDNGSFWHLEASMGVITTHEWSVQGVSEEECKMTEKATFEAPAWLFYPAQTQLSRTQKGTHQRLAEYMT